MRIVWQTSFQSLAALTSAAPFLSQYQFSDHLAPIEHLEGPSLPVLVVLEGVHAQDIVSGGGEILGADALFFHRCPARLPSMSIVLERSLPLFVQEEQLMEMCKVDMVRQAMLELGEVSAQELATFVEQRHGVRIETRIIPILRASVRGREMLERTRQAARAALQTAEKPGGGPKSDGSTASIAAST